MMYSQDRRNFLGASMALAAGAGLAPLLMNQRAFAQADATVRRLAAFSCDVTPPVGTIIYSSMEPLAVVETPLLAKGVILEESGTRYVLCAVDYCELCNSTHDLFVQTVADAAGADPKHVAVQTVHQHTAPMADANAVIFADTISSPPPHPSLDSFRNAAATLGEAVKTAANSLTPFDGIGTGQAKVERVASNRRLPKGDGTVLSRMSSCVDPVLIDMPEGLIDPMLKTITFFAGEKPLVRLHYYATHPQSFYGDPRASYDFVGMAREKLQEQEGVPQIYFTGCSGDIAAGKYNNRTPEAREGLYQRLLAGMTAAVASTQRVQLGAFTWRTAEFPLTPREDKGFTEADRRAEMQDEKKVKSVRMDAAMALAFRARANRPVQLNSLQIGDAIQIVHLPGEPVIAYQLYAQSLAPSRFVAVAGYGDCAMGYICLESMFPEGGYEPTAMQVVPQSEAAFRSAIRQLTGVA